MGLECYEPRDSVPLPCKTELALCQHNQCGHIGPHPLERPCLHSSDFTIFVKDKRDGARRASRMSVFHRKEAATEKALLLAATRLASLDDWSGQVG